MENIITFASMTAAMKARDALKQNRISSRVIRTPAKLRRGSCGYSLTVPKRFSDAVEIIRERNIPYKGVYAGDAR